MTKENIFKNSTKLLIILGFMVIFILLLTTNSNAAVEVTRSFYSNDGSMKFNFTGLTLDTTHEYEFGIAKTAAGEITDWYLIAEYTDTTATVDINTGTTKIREIVNAVNTGYITIRDKADSSVILTPYAVDLRMPYLRVSGYTSIPNGKVFDSEFSIAFRTNSHNNAYYKYVKITDDSIIDEYKEIKTANGDFLQLENLLETTVQDVNWNKWDYWSYVNHIGYPEKQIDVPDTGLYYLWFYFSGDNVKNIYGYTLVDNIQPEIAVEGVSLSATKTVEVGETTTLIATFSPSNATNKIVTWSSSDESVATVSNTGVVTGKKIGSAIITVTTQDGSKVANCTVTVTEVSNNNNNNSGRNNNNSNSSNSSIVGGKDNTQAPGTLPQAGTPQVVLTIVILGLICIISAVKYKAFKQIK